MCMEIKVRGKLKVYKERKQTLIDMVFLFLFWDMYLLMDSCIHTSHLTHFTSAVLSRVTYPPKRDETHTSLFHQQQQLLLLAASAPLSAVCVLLLSMIIRDVCSAAAG